MAQTQLNSSIGASSAPFESTKGYNPPSSGFDYSRKVGTTGDVGMLMPVDCFEVLPGDEFDINCRFIVESLPMQLAPMTNYKVLVHYYFAPWQALWKGAETFVTKGRNASIELTKPSASYSDSYSDDDSLVQEGHSYSLSSPMSLSGYLTIPPVYTQGSAHINYLPFTDLSGTKGEDYFETGNKSLSEVCAMQAFMYQKIYRKNYLPSNLMQDNKVWFPDDISHDDWRIDYAKTNLSVDGHFVPVGHPLPSGTSEDPFISRFIPSANSISGDNSVNIWQLRYAQYGNDYFTSAKPWLVRGEETKINLDVSGLSLSAAANAFSNGSGAGVGAGSPDASTPFELYNPQAGYVDRANQRFKDYISSITVGGAGKATLTANTLRELVAFSVKKEIDALSNGDYNNVIYLHTGKNPGHDDYEPRYIGGTAGYIMFNQITQTSSSVSGSPLGSEAGKGSVSAGGNIGRFKADDHGYIMAIMSIVPEVTYTQGIDRQFTELGSDQVWWPEYNSLGYQPILNKEIFISGDDSVDNDLFGYTTRYSHYKSRRNVVTGLLSLSSEVDKVFGAYAQSRFFDELPKLSNQFVTISPNNVKRDYLSYLNLPAYRIQFASDLNSKRPLPYMSSPNRLGV